MKKQLEGEVTAAILLRNGAPLSISEHENLVSKIKAEIAQTLAETLEGLDTRMKSMFQMLGYYKNWIEFGTLCGHQICYNGTEYLLRIYLLVLQYLFSVH